MIALLPSLSRAIPLAFAAGLNVYATVAVIGLCVRYQLVTLPDDYQVFGHPVVIGVAIAMYLVEFLADKIPWIDSLWDAVHTVIRPLGGAYIAAMSMGDASPTATAIGALIGGSTALTTHATKAGTRAAANTSPEPFSNWFLSIGEDIVAVSLSYGALKHPMVALTVAIVLLLVIVLFASVLIRAIRRRFGGEKRAAT
jgi:uncharacterized protein DUF4126